MTKDEKMKTINKLGLSVGRTKIMFEEGYTASEIAKKLGVGEATVRYWKDQIIDKAETNENK
jgi:transposase